MRKIILFVMAGFILNSLSALAFDGADQKIFEQANQQYRQGHFDQAAKSYQQLTEKYPKQPAFYYDLGNSLFRKGSGALGQAILAYERAQWLAPRDGDIRSNLNYARSLLEYRVEDKRNWYLKASEEVLARLTENEVRLGALASGFAFLAAWIAALTFRRGEAWRWKRKTLLIFFAFFAALALAKHFETRMMSDAVVIAKDAEVRYGPSDTDQVAFRLGEGLHVHIIDTREGWSRILLVNGESGWIDDSQIGKVHP